MANQQKSTYGYETARVPLIGHVQNRLGSSTKDQIFYNCVFDVIRNEVTQSVRVYVTKRGGFTEFSNPKVAGGVGRGLFYWSKSGKTYSVIDDTLYSNTTSIQTLTTSTGTVWFEETTGTSNLLIVCDGTKLYSVTTGDVVTLLTDVDIPTSPSSPVSLDSYLFVFKPNTDEIYNSNVDDPTAWTAGDLINAETYPDNIVKLVRHLNYVVAFGSYSTEWFSDVANATGSPLGRNESLAVKTGCVAPDSVATSDKRLIWVGQQKVGGPSVWMLNGLTASVISNEFIDRVLMNEGSTLSSAIGTIVNHKGHMVYLLRLTTRTLCFDLQEKMWFDWSHNNAGTHATLPYLYYTEGANNILYALHGTNGKVYKLDPTIFQDDLAAIKTEIITVKQDFNNSRWKRILRTEIVGDTETSGTITYQWSDDDYQTWSTAVTLDLTKRSFVRPCGITRRRAHRIIHTGNTNLRLEALEIDYSDGIH